MSDTEEIPPRHHRTPLPKEPLWMSMVMLAWLLGTMGLGFWVELKFVIHLFK